jgi:hypothetical protein
MEKIALAVTWTDDNPTVPEANRLPAEIQICPWFVQFIKGKDIATTEDITAKTWLGTKFIKKASQGKWLFTQIGMSPSIL